VQESFERDKFETVKAWGEFADIACDRIGIEDKKVIQCIAGPIIHW
jgi:hypothetical protein